MHELCTAALDAAWCSIFYVSNTAGKHPSYGCASLHMFPWPANKIQTHAASIPQCWCKTASRYQSLRALQENLDLQGLLSLSHELKRPRKLGTRQKVDWVRSTKSRDLEICKVWLPNQDNWTHIWAITTKPTGLSQEQVTHTHTWQCLLTFRASPNERNQASARVKFSRCTGPWVISQWETHGFPELC